MKVLPIATEVTVLEDVKGRVLSVQLTSGNVITYQVVYYDKLERKTAWFEEWEVEKSGKGDESLTIGFQG